MAKEGKTLYENDYMRFVLEEDPKIIVCTWKQSPSSFDVFKREILLAAPTYMEHKVVAIFWLMKGFYLKVNKEESLWIERNINRYGFESKVTEEIVFVVGDDMVSFLTVVDSFDISSSVYRPRFFANEVDARQWVGGERKPWYKQQNFDINFEGFDEEGSAIIKIKNPNADVLGSFKLFKNLLEVQSFENSKKKDFDSLTSRELEVLEMVGAGKQLSTIADDLFLSVHTVKTHWKNIRMKLSIQSKEEVPKYIAAFNLR